MDIPLHFGKLIDRQTEHKCYYFVTETYLFILLLTILQKPPEIKTNSTGQLAIWLERLTPDQEDVSSNPLCGMNSVGALTTQKTHGVSVFYNGDPDVMHVLTDM